jgi:hypothetical protein
MADEKEYLSLAELEEMEGEVLENFNPEADANALPPPIQPGKYLVKVKHQVEEQEKFWESKKTGKDAKNPGVPYFSTSLWCEIVENPANPKEYHGRRIPVNNVMTLVMNDGTTGAQAVIQALGKGHELANGPQTANRQCVMLSRLLMGEPLIGAEVDWEASWYSKEKAEDLHDRVRGAKKFKKGEDGKYIPEMSIDGDEADVRPFVRRWLLASELTSGSAALHGVSSQKEEVHDAAAPRKAPVPKPKVNKA